MRVSVDRPDARRLGERARHDRGARGGARRTRRRSSSARQAARSTASATGLRPRRPSGGRSRRTASRSSPARSTWPRTTASTGRGTSRSATATSTGRGRTRTARQAWSRSSWASSPTGEAPRIFGDGSQTRDYVYAGDVARATLAAAGAGRRRLQRRHRERDVGGRALRRLPRGGRRRRWMPSRRRHDSASCSAACSTSRSPSAELGWRPEVPLGEGLRLTWESISG